MEQGISNVAQKTNTQNSLLISALAIFRLWHRYVYL